MASDATAEGAPARPRESHARGSNFRRGVILAVIMLFVVSVAYLIGRLQVAGEVREAEARLEEVEQRFEARRDEWQATHAASEAQVHLLEARRQLNLALGALDARNFGMAERHLHTAGLLIEQAEPTGDLAELADEVQATRITVREDLADQRAQLQAFERRFDAIVPPVEPPPARDAPRLDEAPHPPQRIEGTP